MTIYERIRFLAIGGKRSYRHGLEENKKTTELQDFIDEVYKKDSRYYKKLH